MKNHPVLSLLVFTGFLVMGYTFSIRYYQSSALILAASAKGVTSESQNAIKTMDNGQRSILLIGASSISASDPQLEAIWLASYIPSQGSIQLFPIFPADNSESSDFETLLDHSFMLSEQEDGLHLDSSFVSLLEQHNYWWSGYLIFDDTALAKIFDLFGGIELNGKIMAGTKVLDELRKAAASPQEAYASQVTILQSLCHKMAQNNMSPILYRLISLIPDHILTDLDSSQLLAEVDTLYSSRGNPTCRFPTLEISRIEP